MKYETPTTGLSYSDAIAQLEAANPAYDNSELCIDEPGITWPTGVEIAREVGGALAEGFGDRIHFGTFDNCREYGLTFTAGDWTFCCFEHRNSDQIYVEGCPTQEMKEWGPYGCEDKYSMMWWAGDEQYQTVTRALTVVLLAAMRGPLTRAQAIAVLYKRRREMIITVHVPEDVAPDYLRLIADQLEDGFTSGHHDQVTYWETVDDACNDPETLGRIFSHRGQ